MGFKGDGTKGSVETRRYPSEYYLYFLILMKKKGDRKFYKYMYRGAAHEKPTEEIVLYVGTKKKDSTRFRDEAAGNKNAPKFVQKWCKIVDTDVYGFAPGFMCGPFPIESELKANVEEPIQRQAWQARHHSVRPPWGTWDNKPDVVFAFGMELLYNLQRTNQTLDLQIQIFHADVHAELMRLAPAYYRAWINQGRVILYDQGKPFFRLRDHTRGQLPVLDYAKEGGAEDDDDTTQLEDGDH